MQWQVAILLVNSPDRLFVLHNFANTHWKKRLERRLQ